jgi:hypothetical protein
VAVRFYKVTYIVSNVEQDNWFTYRIGIDSVMPTILGVRNAVPIIIQAAAVDAGISGAGYGDASISSSGYAGLVSPSLRLVVFHNPCRAFTVLRTQSEVAAALYR